MLIREQITDHDDDTLVVKKTHDVTSALSLAKHLRDNPVNPISDSRPVGVIPAALLGVWLQEAGVKWEDSAAVDEVIARKLQSGEFSKLRPWDGRF